MIDPHKHKYHDLYWQIAHAAAQQSVATRAKVGAVVVTPSGMLSIGWNGMPPGLPNPCETVPVHENGQFIRMKTDPRVIHAERNAIDKMTREGVPVAGSLLFITLEPCLECAKSICSLGLKAIFYDERHDTHEGLALLVEMGIPIYPRDLIRAKARKGVMR